MAKYKIYIGTYSKGEGNGLFRGEFDGETGEIRIKDTLDIENPSYLQLNENNNILYGVSEVGSFDGEKGGALFSVDISDNSQMRLIDMKCTHGRSPCHLCVSPRYIKEKDNLIFVSNYSEGSLSIFQTDISGNIKPSLQSIHHFGKSVNPNRQEASHIHFAEIILGKYLAVCDLGLDKIFLYPNFVNPAQNLNGLITDSKTIDCPPGSGPRHFAVSKDIKYLYVLTEMGNTVLVYECKGGDPEQEFELIQEISTLPSDFTGRSTAAAIHVSPDGKYLGASNRGHDSIAVFRIKDGGGFSFATHIMTGKEPRDFRFSPDGKFLIAANQGSDSLTVYSIENDKFIDANNITLPKPVCILFGEEIK